MITRMTREIMLEKEKELKELFEMYYKKAAPEGDLLNKDTLFALVLNNIETRMMLVTWDKDEDKIGGFIILEIVENKIKHRKECVIWTIFNRDEEIGKEVFDVIVDSWAKEKNAEAVVIYSDEPFAFNRYLKSLGYSMILGVFEKKLGGDE